MKTPVNGIIRIHGKPFDYFKLGKSFSKGRPFMDYMGRTAQTLMAKANTQKAISNVKQCPICRSSKNQPVLMRYGFIYRQCMAPLCRHVFVANRVKDKIRNLFFSQNSQYSKKNYCDSKISEFRIKEIATPKVEFVMNYVNKGANSWLDVGCGSGEILFVLKEKKWNAVGLELGSGDVEFAKYTYGVDVRQATLEDFVKENNKKFDVISFFGVVHCVPDPNQLIQGAATLLKPGGILVIEIPHHDSVEFSAIKTFPKRPSRSCYNGLVTLHHFTEKSTQRLLSQANLKSELVWYFGTDIFELLNQWSYAQKGFIDSALQKQLLQLANDLQQVIDQRERSSNMVWIARKQASWNKNQTSNKLVTAKIA